MQSDEPLCPKAQLSGYTVDGSFQQYAVAKAAHVARLSKDTPLDGVSPVLCAGITVYKGIKESGARPGQTVAIVGAGGGLGSLAQQYCKAMGIRTIAIDAGDDKEKMCKELGSYAFVDFSKSKNVVKDVQAATEDGLGPHAVILLAVSEKPFQQAAEVSHTYSISSTLTRSLIQTSTSVPVVPSSASVCPPVPTSRPPYSSPSSE
jgi:propanol-preferring alcohol dehydrogenase